MPKGLKGFQKNHPQLNTGRTHFKKGQHPNNEFKRGNKGFWLNKKRPSPSFNTRKKLSDALKGEKNWRWIKDRTRLKINDKRSDPATIWWKKEVKKRDNFTCKINNVSCAGEIVIHHILPWRDYPELRHQINNGITLCQAHHPRKRADEQKLITFFQSLIK